MMVGTCDCDCVYLFLCQVGSCAAHLRPPIKCGAYSSPPQSLQVAGVSAGWCVGGSQCLGLGALVCAGSLPVAAWQGLGPLALSGLFWGVVHPCSGIDTHSALWLPGGPSWVPALWVAFGYLWLRSPACLSQVLGGRSVAPHVCY
ncbi:hypothetical protein AMECASPLE_035568 [Ameca splendens]|uniref:Uncharacterized protein n=1 Tax=Ameca splendens TaxID=208324 RepID=A0ABV0Y7D6_9TELE